MTESTKWYSCVCVTCGRAFSCSSQVDVCFDCERAYDNYQTLLAAIAELRAEIIDDFDQMTQGAMIGSPLQCVECATRWIKERKAK